MSYNKEEISKKLINEISLKLFSVNLISLEQFAKIRTDFKCGLYTPSVFVRIGLFIFTLILINAALGIAGMAIFDMFNGETVIGIASAIASVTFFVILEFFINKKQHYRSGIDDCLLYTAVFFMICGIILIIQDYEILAICIMALPVLLLAVWRYADSFVALMALICFYTIVFLILKDSQTGRLWMPFIFMSISIGFVAIINTMLNNNTWFYYERCFQVLKAGTLLALYASMNYFVVKEANQLLNEGITVLPFEYIFMVFTMVLPILYIIIGLKRKDRLLLCTGLGVLFLTVLTFKYKYDSIDYKYLMTGLGMIFLLISWQTIKYLKNNASIFTFASDQAESGHQLLNAEAILISQTLGHPQTITPDQTEFGGGGFGGGGAGGNI